MYQRGTTFIGGWLILMCLWASASVAQTPEIEQENSFKNELGDEVNALANRLDSYFGEKRADDEKSGSTMRVSPGLTVGEFASPQSAVGVLLNLKLKNLEKFGRDIDEKLFGRNNDDDSAGNRKDLFGNSLNNHEQWDWTRSWETRAAGLAPPTYGTLIRIRKNFKGQQMIHRFWWSTGWSSDVLWLDQVNFSSDYKINDSFLFRWVNQWTWNMSSSLMSTSHGPSFYQTLSENLSIAYDTRVNMAIEANGWVLDNYGFSSTIRRRLPNKWIFLEANPGINFGRAHFFQRDLSIFARVEFVFGDI